MSIISKLLIVTSLAYTTVSFADTSSMCPNETGFYYTNYRQRNPTKGGFVSNQAFVEDSDNVFISPTAAVCGSSSVSGSVKIFGTAIINNATITGNVNIKDNAKIIGANVSDNAIISGNAYINGTDVIIREKAQVSGNATVTGDAIIGGTAIIGGYAHINTGNYSTEIIKPNAGKDDIPGSTPEDIERAKYIATMLNSVDQIQSEFNKYDSSAGTRSSQQLLNLWEEYYTKIASPDIEQLKSLMLQRQTADFSNLSVIDGKIKKLNKEIGLLYNPMSNLFAADLYNFFETNKLKDTAIRTEKMRLRFYIYSHTYAGALDSSRGSKQFATIEDAKAIISKGESNYSSTVYNW